MHEITGMCFVDLKTGKTIDIDVGSVIDYEMIPAHKSNDEQSFPTFIGDEVTLSLDGEFADSFNEAFCAPNTTGTYTLEFEEPIYAPARRHKRHRIQKKWIKRYGMKQVGSNRYKMKDVKMNIEKYDEVSGLFDIAIESASGFFKLEKV